MRGEKKKQNTEKPNYQEVQTHADYICSVHSPIQSFSSFLALLAHCSLLSHLDALPGHYLNRDLNIVEHLPIP